MRFDPAWVFLLGTLAKWTGWAFLFHALTCVVRMAAARLFGGDLAQTAVRSAWIGAVLLVAGQFMPAELGHKVEASFWLPVAWLYMPFPGWLVLAGVIMAANKIAQVLGSITEERSRAALQSGGAWLAAAVVGAIWFVTSKAQATIFRGAIQAQPSTLVGLLALAVVAVYVMAVVQRKAKAKGLATKLAQHIVLLAGCVVFGIPFAWMLITSFKEDRDMANTNGVVWVPKVQLTHGFDDPERPLVQTKLDGRWVQATVTRESSAGKLELEIERPYLLRGRTFSTDKSSVTAMTRQQPIWTYTLDGTKVTAFTVQERTDGKREAEVMEPASLKGKRFVDVPEKFDPVRQVGLRWQNYTEALEWMPFETNYGLKYLQNTLVIVVMSVIGTVLSSSLVAYGFGRLRFPWRDQLFNLMLATMMLPAAVTMMPRFLIFRGLGWIDTLLPLWVPAFFASAFNVFLLRQFFSTIPMELEEAARIDGCGYFQTFWKVMLPQVKPALAAIAIWTFMGAWNDFLGPLIYVMSPENLPLSYALQLFSGDRGTEAGLMMAFSTMTVVPVILLFFLAQKYFIEGVQLSGLGGR